MVTNHVCLLPDFGGEGQPGGRGWAGWRGGRSGSFPEVALSATTCSGGWLVARGRITSESGDSRFAGWRARCVGTHRTSPIRDDRFLGAPRCTSPTATIAAGGNGLSEDSALRLRERTGRVSVFVDPLIQCSWCDLVKDLDAEGETRWSSLELWTLRHGGAPTMISHGICHACEAIHFEDQTVLTAPEAN